MAVSYKQETKNLVRHTVIKEAVQLLTNQRSDACCVRRSYVRDLYDYFSQLSESHEQQEAQKIDLSYIQEWERLHANSIGTKRPDELLVCYLSGPEPENDFNEFVSLGVLPQNIWAFESERNTYLQALTSIKTSEYMQPKIVKTSIEKFFEISPRVFDIVYIDSCASLISDQHTLRCIASLFKHNRLNSPGVLISNFALFDTTSSELAQYIDIISRYSYIRSHRSAPLYEENGHLQYGNDFTQEHKRTEESIEDAYGEFISSSLQNIASIVIPTLRFCNSTYLQSLSQTAPIHNPAFRLQGINTIRDNTLYKFFATNQYLQQNNSYFLGISKAEKLRKEIEFQYNYDLLSSLQKVYLLKTTNTDICPEIQETLDYFDTDPTLYQFLDKPNRILFFDAVINQLSCPMHYVTNKSVRLTYIAKQTRMFTDLLLFDDCRYIYDWLPAIHQIPSAFSNPSWQYTFRFALDGLIKQRMNYNNEFFFQGSVISKTIDGFEAQIMSSRTKIN